MNTTRCARTYRGELGTLTHVCTAGPYCPGDCAPAPTYLVIDNQTDARAAGPFGTLRAARRKADRLDLEYGAIRYRVSRVG